MNNVKEIQRLNAREATLSTSHSQTGSWHEQYKDSAHIFVGGLPYHLTEGDIICVVSQFGEVAGINLVRDKDTGKSKGYAFLKYVDQRSTILAVDNLNGAQIAGRTIRVDHVQNYKVPKVFDADGNEIEPDEDTVNNAAPKPIQVEASDDDDDESSESEVDDTGIDIDDPMREYLLKKRKKEARKAKRKAEKEAGSFSESKAERKARKELKKAAKRDKDGGSGGRGKKSKSKSSSSKDKDDKESSPLMSLGTKVSRDGGELMDVDSKKDEQPADKTQKDSSITDRNTTINKDTSVGGAPPSSSSRQDRRRSRSRSPHPRSRSRSRSPRTRQRSTDRRRGRSQSRERYRAISGGGGRDDYNSGRDRRRGNSRERRRDDSRERKIEEIRSGDDSKDRKMGSMDDPYPPRRRKESPQRRASPDSSSHRRRRDDYDRDHHRGSRYRSRSRSPLPRRAGAGDRRRSRSRSPKRY